MIFKRRQRDVLAIILIALSMALFFSFEGLAATKFIIKPKISASWQVDNNFYRAEDIERDVSSYLIQPGIEFGVETAKSRLFLDYTLNSYTYDDKDTIPPGEEPADEEDYIGHMGILKARTRIFERLLLGLDDSYYKTRDPAQSDRFSNAVDRDKYFINRLTPLIFYEFGPKFTAGLRYSHTETDYSSADNEDSTEHRGMFDLVYNFTRTVSLDLEYQLWERDYDLATSDYTSGQIKLIFRKQFKYFSLEAGGGSHKRDFDDPALEDVDVFTYRIAIMGQNPPAPEPNPRSYIIFDVEQNLNESGIGDTYFRATRFSLNAGNVFMKKIPVTIKGYYQISDYETMTGLTPEGATELREDKTYDISGSLGYMFTDWLTFSVAVGFENRDSNLAGYDYDNRYFLAKFELSYNL